MTKTNKIIALALLCMASFSLLHAEIDTRIVLVNHYQQQSGTMATLSIDIELKTDGTAHDITVAQNAIRLGSALTAALDTVLFTDPLIGGNQQSTYNTTLDYLKATDLSVSMIRFIYTFDSGDMVQLPATNEWVKLMSLDIIYDTSLTSGKTDSITWFPEPYPPVFAMVDENNAFITGNEATVGGELLGISLDPAPLAVELISYEATSEDGRVELNWQTASETENLRFTLERSDAQDGEFSHLANIEGAGNSDIERAYIFTDEEIEPGKEYFYRLKDVDFNGRVTVNGVVSIKAAAIANYELDTNYPNPFNPETTIKFKVKQTGKVDLAVYNMQGQLVRQLVNDNMSSGHHTIVWNGRDDEGMQASSGTYFYRMSVNGFNDVKKMQLLK